MNSNLKKQIFIILITFSITQFVLFSQEECRIDREIYDYTESDCKQFNDTLKKAVKQLIKRIEININNPNTGCIPLTLVELMSYRFCGSGSDVPITIICDECKEEEIKKWVWCGNRKKQITVIKKRRGGAVDFTQIKLCKDEIEKGVDNIEMILFHETIHIVENYYGYNKYKNKHISNENYSYTCTEKYYSNLNCAGRTYPPPSECPVGEYEEICCPTKKVKIKCLDCDQYYPPGDPIRK